MTPSARLIYSFFSIPLSSLFSAVAKSIITDQSRSDTTIGEDFKEDAMSDTSIQDMYPINSCLDSINTIIQFRKHTTLDKAITDQGSRFIYSQFRNQCGDRQRYEKP